MQMPSVSAATETVGPSYLSVEGSSFQEPFHGFCCEMQGRAITTNDAKAQTVAQQSFVMIYLEDQICGLARFQGRGNV